MKKILLSLCFLLVISAGIAMADSYTVAVDTYVPTAVDLSATWPNIDGPAKIGEIIITNSGATIQTVTFYELSESSLTATAVAVAVSETTGTIKINLQDEAYTDLGIVKSATGSTVNVTVFYE